MIFFGLYSGQRLSDIATLTWSNIDLLKDEIRLETGKTGRVMTIPIAQTLREHIESLPAPDDTGAFVHPRAAKTPQPTLSGQFACLLESAGLRKALAAPKEEHGSRRRNLSQLSFHSLRHTAVSLLKDAGLPQAVVQEYVGHSSALMSARYTHVGVESLRRAAASLPKI